MIVLGIETSTDVCSVGLAGDKRTWSERSLVEKHIHSEKLFTLIRGTVDDALVSLSQIDGVAVSVGPGSFTGLRIGLSAAKGLCFSLGVPLTAVSTFQALVAAAQRDDPGLENILVALDAKKGDFYAALFSPTQDAPAKTVKAEVVKAAALAQFDRNVQLVLTDRPDLFTGERFQVRHVHEYSRGAIVAQLGARQLQSGILADVRTLEPMYLKDFVALKKAPVG